MDKHEADYRAGKRECMNCAMHGTPRIKADPPFLMKGEECEICHTRRP
jgi:hypothetical protein